MALPKVLLIEDEESTFKVLSNCLADSASIIWIKRGKQAFQAIEKEEIKIIFLSEFPEDIDGIVLIKHLKKKFPSVPIVFIASYLTVEKTIQIFKNGARELVQFPLKKDEVGEICRRILNFLTNQHTQVVTPGQKIQQKKYWFKEYFNTLKFPNSPKKISVFLKKIRKHNLLKKVKSIVNIPFPNREKIRKIGKPKKIERAHDISGSSVEANETTIVKVYFLGKFCIYLNNVLITDWPSKKVRCLFAYMVLHHKRRIHRDVLMNRFWPNSTADSARNCLNVTLHGIRNVFNEAGLMADIIQYHEECYFLNPDIELYKDFEDFRKRWHKAQAIEREEGINAALTHYENTEKIYGGEFMEDEPFEELWESDRENLREISLVVLDKISKCYSLDGKPDVAIKICQEILQKDNCREDVHQRLMKCYYRVGKRDKALKQFQQCTNILKDEFDVFPSTKTKHLYDKIKNNENITEKKNKRKLSVI